MAANCPMTHKGTSRWKIQSLYGQIPSQL